MCKGYIFQQAVPHSAWRTPTQESSSLLAFQILQVFSTTWIDALQRKPVSRELVTFPLHPLNPWADLPISVPPAGEPTPESSEVKFPSWCVLFAGTLLNRLRFFLQSIISPSPLLTLDLKAAQHAHKTFQKFWMATMTTRPSEVPCLECSHFCLWPWLGFIYILAYLCAVTQGQNVSNKHEEQHKPSKDNQGIRNWNSVWGSRNSACHIQGHEQFMHFLNLKVANRQQ